MQRALYVLFGALAGYVLFGAFAAFGVAAVAVNLLTPLPAAYTGMRFGPPSGWATVALTAGLVLLGSSAGPSGMYLLQFGLPAGVLAWLLNGKVPWDRAVFITLGAMVAASLLALTIVAQVQGSTPVDLAGAVVDQEVSQAAGMMQEIFADSDLPQADLAEINQALDRMSDFMRDVYAGLAITVSMFMLLGLVLMLGALGRNHYRIPGVAFADWKAPEPMIWLLILAGFAVFFGDGFSRVFAMNLLVILLPIYFLQGLAIIDNFFRRKAFSPIIRSIGYLLVVLVNPLPMLVACMGIFDLWVDFRKPRVPRA